MNNNDVLAQLFDPKTIRQRAHTLLNLAKENKLAHFTVAWEHMMPTASFVTEVILENYPNLNIPYHSRWRHFEAGGLNRISNLLDSLQHLPTADQGKILYELVIISVFLDAGAGQSWQYQEPGTNQYYSRSEGLALASLHLYQNGTFSAHPYDPLRVDAQRLIEFNENDLREGFQVTGTNPLEGVAGRVALLNRLGAAVQTNKRYFGDEGRLGDFYAYICSLEKDKRIEATEIFHAVLGAFNNIWPARLSFEGVALGDVWQHSALHTNNKGSDLVPFHKLSQWLSYSLIEPLEREGIEVSGLDQLTGLPEYRNGGLLIDTGLLRFKNQDVVNKSHEPGSEFIVEWRALTVALLDELADLIRQNLHKDAKELPLAKILQGGTWEAGRRIAKQKRSQGTPPIQIISDGTVF